VAGSFYPDEPEQLRAEVARALGAVPKVEAATPKAIIAPHAGYVYSGPVAASAYACLEPVRHTVRRVVLLGPAHRVHVDGLAVSSADAFATPLGQIPVDAAAREAILKLAQVQIGDEAHALEHSLEVHLPFLQVCLDEFAVVPLVVGVCRPDDVADVLDVLWGGPETLIVVSTDLSHYHDYETAKALDTRTAAAIVAARAGDIGDRDACGAYPVRGLLEAAARHQLAVQGLDLRNSGDTAGPRDRVVGYGSFALV
jgi:AmmeMemoRadiSam system protein B